MRFYSQSSSHFESDTKSKQMILSHQVGRSNGSKRLLKCQAREGTNFIIDDKFYRSLALLNN
jgi:hypothetical protein